MSKFRQYMVSLMNDKRNGLADGAVKGLLRLVSWIYAAAVKVVDWSYTSGLRRQYKVSVPVVSVGNITLGGTGKTPFTIFLADHFQAKGKKPAVLTRGYGKDESRMLGDELPDVPILIGQDRVRSALMAAEGGSDVIILDDAFQHRRIGRDLNILMLDAANPFGNGELFPRGVLREPVSSMGRADVFALSKTDRIDEGSKEDLLMRLKELFPDKPVIITRHRPTFLSDVTGAAYSVESFRGKKVCIVSGIVDADYFAYMVEEMGAIIVSRIDHGDHHKYTQTDIDSIRAECVKSGAEAVIITKKDHVKFRDLDISEIESDLYLLNVVIDIIEGKEEFLAGLNTISNG